MIHTSYEEFIRDQRKKVHAIPECHCIIWDGAKDNRGYGLIHLHHNGVIIRSTLVHCYAFDLMYPGRRNLTHHIIRHTCNNKLCINPLHLYVTDRMYLKRYNHHW